MGYLGYYLAWMVLSYGLRQPWLLAGLVGLWLLRGVVPTPGALFGALGRAGRLREQVRVNRANITARRDLATIYLGLLRPKRAVELLEEGLALAPEDAELLYLHGLSLYRAGDYERALQQELAALERDAAVRQGHPYFVAGDALLALKRWDDAADAFERYIDFNSSDVSAHTRLARAYAGSGDVAAAQKWLFEGLATWHSLPGAMKRRQFGAYLGAQRARVTVLKQPLAVAVMLLFVVLCGLAARSAYPIVADWFRDDADGTAGGAQRLKRALSQCGKISMGEFEGQYESVGGEAVYSNLRIERDRIIFGAGGSQDLCLTELEERKPGALHAKGVLRWYAANTDPAAKAVLQEMQDMNTLVDVRLDANASQLNLRIAPIDNPSSTERVLLRRR
ncbi:MAG TPA: CDC27 family protein [Polyangiaceae bacterium]|nr:CDC27 family protein [Polyangiaceae bacterium]